jgi:hypothetical protein
VRIDRLKIFLDSMGGGAWPFLVGGVICLVNSVNERDLGLLNSLGWFLSARAKSHYRQDFLEGLSVISRWKFEAITGL